MLSACCCPKGHFLLGESNKMVLKAGLDSVSSYPPGAFEHGDGHDKEHFITRYSLGAGPVTSHAETASQKSLWSIPHTVMIQSQPRDQPGTRSTSVLEAVSGAKTWNPWKPP